MPPTPKDTGARGGKPRRPKRGGGRPTLLTEETQGKIVNAILAGVPLAHAARAAGVSPDTVGLWKQKAAEGSARHVAFVDAIEGARSQCIGALVLKVRTHAQDSIESAKWLLERLAHEEFSLSGKLAAATMKADATSGDAGTQHVVLIEDMTDVPNADEPDTPPSGASDLPGAPRAG